MVLIWPLCMLESVVHDEGRFLIWTGVSQTWTFLAASYIIVVPLFEEVRDIYNQYLKKSGEKKDKPEDGITVVDPFVE